MPRFHVAPLAAAARRHLAEIHSRADEIEALRKLPQDLAKRLAADGLYSVCTPAAWGGPGGAPRDYAEVVETLAEGDASTGWCSFIATTSSWSIASARTDDARALLREPGMIAAGVFAPMGRARRVIRDGAPGFVVNGRWAWGSGSQNADWIIGGCLLTAADGKVIRDEGGAAVNIAMVFGANQISFLDTWDVFGLQGTGSTDFEVREVFVPEGRAIARFGAQPTSEPIFRFPAFGMLAIGVGAVALGAARGAIDAFIGFAQDKIQPSGRSLAQRTTTQTTLAQAEAALRAGRAFFYEAIDAAWASAAEGPVDIVERRDLRLAISHAAAAAKTAVDLIQSLTGGSGVYRRSPVQRRFRDVHVACQHILVSPVTYEMSGRLLLGLETDTDQL